jgi:CubicO group peptidase (beta-lactamase class C family)
MKRLFTILIIACACGSSPREATKPVAAVAPPAAPPSAAAAGDAVALPQPRVEHLVTDSPRTTSGGTTFVAPGGWSIASRDNVVVLDPPEAGSHIVLVDVTATDADAAVAAAWVAYDKDAHPVVSTATDWPPREGWDQQRTYAYETSTAQHRRIRAVANRHGATWTISIHDLDLAVSQKRSSQISTIFDHLQPQGYQRESFAGKQAHRLDVGRIEALKAFVTTAQAQLGVPGVAIGLVQDGKVVFAGGLGVRELGKTTPVDAETLFIIASNTKAMTTLLLAELVDDHKLNWDTPVTELMPAFKLGDAETTRQVLVKHLVCACTGLPRQDLEWLMKFKYATPLTELATLATVQPTSKFGEMYQYSNLLAAAGGFVAAHVLSPEQELGAAYNDAMRTRVFGPLGMTSTTFDFKRALAGNHAGAHAPDIDGNPAAAAMAINYAIVPLRPAGGAWSSVNDMLRFVLLELGLGVLDGKRVVSEAALLARRAPQVAIGSDATYGMGLEVDHTWGIPVVHHGGSMIGYKSDMIWLPDHGVGAVILTNSDRGRAMLEPFRRRLLEVLFDGKPEAQADVAASATQLRAADAAERKRLTMPADPAEAKALAARYHNDALGTIEVAATAKRTTFDFGEFASEVASRTNDDGTRSFSTVVPGFDGLDFVAGGQDGKRTLTLRDAQHAYVFTEVAR